VSKSNTEIVAASLAAYNEGDEAALQALLHPEIEVFAEPGALNSGRYTGWEGFRKWLGQWEDVWEEASYEPLEMEERGDLVIVPTRVTATGVGSGVEIDAVFTYVYEVVEGKMTRFHTYRSAENAARAVAELEAGSE
jgi:ketosteroid isomerase-like protein